MDEPLTYLLIILAVYVLGKVFRQIFLPRIKGASGERYVASILKSLNKKDYLVYNNIYLRKGGGTTQIDHLVVSIYGIFVIETKNYKGWIFGNENSKYWTQTLYKEKHKIYNPIIQNWTHINFLRNTSTELKYLQFFSIVVFAGDAKL